MMARAVNAAARVIAAAMEQGKRTPAGWAMALESAQLLNSPEHATEHEQLRELLAAEELAYERLRVALESAKRGRREARAQVAELQAERHTTNEALSQAAEQLRLDRDRIAELEAAQGAVFRASHDSIVIGHYTTRDEARKHCETLLRRDVGDEVFLGWAPDHGGDDAPEELCIGEDVECSGYYVTPLEVASEYDEEADE
jgi:hypothetical protein